MSSHSAGDAHELVSAARDLVRIDDARTAGLWPRAAAMLARQSLDASMSALWALRSPGMQATTTRCQLLCLGEFLGDADLAGRVSVTWSGLARACHVRVYDLPPSVENLRVWLDCAWQLAEAVTRAQPADGAKAQGVP